MTQGHHIRLSRAVTGWAQALMTWQQAPDLEHPEHPFTCPSLSGQSPKTTEAATSTRDAILGAYLYYKLFIGEIQNQLHILYFYLQNVTMLPKPRGLWVGRSQWSTPTNVVKAPAARFAEKGGQSGRPGQSDSLPGRARIPPSKDSGVQ